MITSLLCIGDLHRQFDKLNLVAEWARDKNIDATLFTGDFNDLVKYPDRLDLYNDILDKISERLTEISDIYYFVPGNHDGMMTDVEQNIDRKVVEINDLKITGIGGSGPKLLGFPYEWTDQELNKYTFQT